jgi:uncharacterized SAM-binding protein YcdF (DUF218 family)
MNRQTEPSNKSIFKLLRSILIGLAIPIISLWLWYSSRTTNPFDEYSLIIEGVKANGFITKVEKHEDVAELYEGRKSVQVFDYSYEYTFNLPNGNIIKSYGNEPGQIHDGLVDLEKHPYPITVQYLVRRPEINRVLEMDNSKTVYQWIRRRMLLGLTILLFTG